MLDSLNIQMIADQRGDLLAKMMRTHGHRLGK
jgi:hypothetical protein